MVRASDLITEGRGFKSHLGLGFFRVYVSPRILVNILFPSSPLFKSEIKCEIIVVVIVLASIQLKTDVHEKDLARTLALKYRLMCTVTRKWPFMHRCSFSAETPQTIEKQESEKN